MPPTSSAGRDRNHATEQQHGGSALPIRTRKQLAGECLYSGCHEPVKDADYCPPHHERVKREKREWAARQRKRLRRARLCLDCHKPSRKARCGPCRAARKARVERDAKKVECATTETRASFRSSLETNGDGREYQVKRYGRARRGAPSTADRDADLKSLLGDAIDILARIIDTGMALVRSPALAELGAIARREARDELADQFIRVRGIATEGAEYYSPGRCREVDALRDEADG